MASKPIHEVFRKRAQRIGVVLSSRLDRFRNWHPDEKMNVFVHPKDDGTSLVQFQRESDHGCWIEFDNVTASGTANTNYGDETLLKAEDLGAISERYTNNGAKPVEVSFGDLFSKTDSKETETSGGTSTKITVEAEEGIEGFGSVKESVEQEVHAEFAERSGTEITNEQSGEEGTTVPVGADLKITQTRQRADTELEVTSDAKFTFTLRAGAHDHRWNHGWKGNRPLGHAVWDTWQDFCDVIKGDAPDNMDLASSFKRHPGPHYYLDALNELDGEVRYKVRFEGKIIKNYDVEPLNDIARAYLEAAKKKALADAKGDDE